jgi:hypothetical protein
VQFAPQQGDSLLPATVEESDNALEHAKLEVTVTAPFCCESLGRVFEAQLVLAADYPPATCYWLFGDGRDAYGCRVSHRFYWPGEYTSTVTVTLSDGTTLTSALNVAVGYSSDDYMDDSQDVDSDKLDPDVPDDAVPGVLRVEYLAGPEGPTSPGRYEVAWRFPDAAPDSGVRLRSGCCECPSADSSVLVPDVAGIYTATIDIPHDRSSWYFVTYLLDGEELAGPVVHAVTHSYQASAGQQSIVIWPFVGSRAEPDSVATALRSGLITHVAIFAGNRTTSDTLDALQTREAIAIAQRENTELILIRILLPTQPGPTAEVATLFDRSYYVQEIELLREEADRIGAASIGLDTETYGLTPLADHFRAQDGFLADDFNALVETINEVVAQTGQVDFVLPAGSVRENHPYGALAALGRQRISESTYYDNEQDIDWIPYLYDLAGMYMNVRKDHPERPMKPYFLPWEVFGEKAYIWQRTHGLMIWPKEELSLEVADMLATFAGQCPANPDYP